MNSISTVDFHADKEEGRVNNIISGKQNSLFEFFILSESEERGEG